MNRILSALFWMSLVLGAAIYGVMVLRTLPAIQASAAGLAPFDLRPAGYSYEEALGFLTALGGEGRALYLGVQHWLDLFYPLCLAIMVYCGIVLLAPRRIGRGRWLLALVAVPGTLFDWRENALVAEMLTQEGPVAPDLVAAASRATLLKSATTTVALTVLLALFLARAWQSWRERRTRGAR